MERLRLELPAREGAPRRAREATRGACADLAEVVRARALLVVSEMVGNAVEHAWLEEDELIELRVSSEGDRCRIEVDDAGVGFTSGPRRHCPQAEAIHGRGLFLVSRLSSRWGVERLDQKTHVWAEIT
jgi:anti-sigma regulatory factor (Ser/Thr protein kinase)